MNMNEKCHQTTSHENVIPSTVWGPDRAAGAKPSMTQASRAQAHQNEGIFILAMRHNLPK